MVREEQNLTSGGYIMGQLEHREFQPGIPTIFLFYIEISAPKVRPDELAATLKKLERTPNEIALKELRPRIETFSDEQLADLAGKASNTLIHNLGGKRSKYFTKMLAWLKKERALAKREKKEALIA